MGCCVGLVGSLGLTNCNKPRLKQSLMGFSLLEREELNAMPEVKVLYRYLLLYPTLVASRICSMILNNHYILFTPISS